MGADQTPIAARPYVMMAGASDLYEIRSSQLALRKSHDPKIRALATMLISHHRMTTRQVTAAAHRAGLTPPPPTLMPRQRQMIAELEPLSGRAFDRVYLRQQTMAHELALNLHRNYAGHGDARALRAAAAGAVPIIRRHIARIRALS